MRFKTVVTGFYISAPLLVETDTNFHRLRGPRSFVPRSTVECVNSPQPFYMIFRRQPSVDVERRYFTATRDAMALPDLIEVQKDS